MIVDFLKTVNRGSISSDVIGQNGMIKAGQSPTGELNWVRAYSFSK